MLPLAVRRRGIASASEGCGGECPECGGKMKQWGKAYLALVCVNKEGTCGLLWKKH